jgi:DNA-binding NarL/FixJ family response regulator
MTVHPKLSLPPGSGAALDRGEAPGSGAAPSGEALSLPENAITLLVVNGNEAMRIGFAVLLRRQPWVRGCLMAEDLGQATALARRHRPEAALLDISNAAPFAGSMTRALHDAHSGLQIVLSSRCATTAGAPPGKLGAVAFLPPTASSDETVSAVRDAVLSLNVAPPAAEPNPPHALTERELELLVLISTGATNREIGRHLHLGPDSIKKYAAALYRKLGVRNRTEAARMAAELVGAAG